MYSQISGVSHPMAKYWKRERSVKFLISQMLQMLYFWWKLMNVIKI